MHAIYELKEMLMDELKDIGNKGELTAGTLETVDKLAHSIKNICKIIEEYEGEEYSSRGGSYAGSYEGSYEGGNMGGNTGGNMGGGMSGARGGRGGRGGRRGGANQYGSYAGGYSRAGEEIVQQLRELMQEAPDGRIRQDIQRLISKMQNM